MHRYMNTYIHLIPKQFLLFCEVPAGPGNGGETVITDVRDLKRRIDANIVQKCSRLGVNYLRHMPDKHSDNAWYHSWQEVSGHSHNVHVAVNTRTMSACWVL